MHLSDSSTSGAKITVEVRAFARYSEILGLEEMTLELAEPATVADAIALLRARAPNGDRLPQHPLVAVRLEQVRGDTPLTQGDTLALLPPLAGG